MPRDRSPEGTWQRTLGGPRGMLRLYILYRLDKKPATGYELMQEMSSFTGGSWSPGSGSIYPVFKQLQGKGLIKVVSRGSRSKQVFALTRLGQEALSKERDMFNDFATKWTRIRQMVMDLLTPQTAVKLIHETVENNKATWERVMESKDIAGDEKVFRLKEYRLLIENELKWIEVALREIGKKIPAEG